MPASALSMVFQGARKLRAAPTPVIGCQLSSNAAVPAPGLLQEQVEPVLVEDVERIRAAQRGQLAEPDARRRHTVDPGVVEHAELILGEPVEVMAAEPGGVEMHLLEGVQ